MAKPMRHTPGPWRWRKPFDWPESERYLTSCSGYVIAYLSERWKTKKKIDANANLIAAAPEMLASLVALVDGVSVLAIYLPHLERLAPTINMARDAIAKATKQLTPAP